MSRHPHHQAALDLQAFPLLQALFGRRSRRFGAGMSIPDGPLAYRSDLPPQPLSELERTLLVLAGAGVSGLNLGMPYTPGGAPDTLCNYPVRPVGRTYPSGAGTYGSELLITDDSGSYITRLRDAAPATIRTYSGPDDLFSLVEATRAAIVRIGAGRISLPARYPHISGHNRWVANQPGTTLFVPVGDQVDSLFNRLWIAVGEGIPVSDGKGRLLGDPAALLAAEVLREERALPLPALEAQSRSSLVSELTIASYNIQLMLQAMGLGGWLFSGINPMSLLGAFAAEGVPGFGFRFATDAPTPTPLGLDGVFEPLVPPYVTDFTEAAGIFAARKFGPDGVFGENRPGPYRDDAAVRGRADPGSKVIVAYLASVAEDAVATFGRFPATVPPVAIATYTQAQHIDTAYYDRFFGDGAYLETHARHQSVWHGAPERAERRP